MTDNEFGVEYAEIKIKKVRYHRTDGKWLVEYQRHPRWIFGLDALWWFNDGTYVNYYDAVERVQALLESGVVHKVQFQKAKVFEVE